MKKNETIDLHMHTTVSDGTDTPEEILARVRDAGIDLFSVTDHDAIKAAGIIPGILSDGDPAFLPGVELSCRDREGIYAVLREKMDWKDWYGSNLDALWDVLTGLEHRGERFRLILPPEEGEIASYAKLVRETFREAGALEEE
jgi:predicted metal-dependent phosphoesterase TrpH